jgi:uncharacterized protein YjeT (DUF2065 family)
MKFGKTLCLLNAVIFFVYGIFYMLAPAAMSTYVTESIPTTSSALIDMRAIYGGMSIAIGIVLAILSLKNKTLRTAIMVLMIFMITMASGRLLGVVLDTGANNKMYYYLISEVLIALVCGIWLKNVKVNKSSSND